MEITLWVLEKNIFKLLSIKSNVIMKGINFNQRPISVARRSSRATCDNSTERMWELVLNVSVPSGFSILIMLGVFCNSSVPSRAFVMRYPLELIIMPLLGGSFSHLIPCRQPDLGVQYNSWSKVGIRGTTSTTPFNE